MKKILDRISRATDRAISGAIGKQLLFFSVIVAVVFLLLFAAIFIVFAVYSTGETFNSWFWNVLYSFMDVSSFGNTSVRSIPLVLIANLLGKVIFVGIMVSILTNAVLHRISRVKNGEVYYAFTDHVIIIGFDHICKGLVEQLAADNDVILQTSRDIQSVRQNLFSGLSAGLAKKVNVVSGNRVSPDDIKKLRAEKCRQVFLLGETDEDDRDSRNIECLGIIGKFAKEAGTNIRCHVLFEHQSTFTAFQQQEIPGIRESIDFVPFNFCDMWAQKIFAENTYNNGEINYTPLDHQPITADSEKRVHLAILGMSDMGIALGIQAAQLCHFPNFVTKGIKTRITFIDENADRRMNLLKNQLQGFFNEIEYSLRSADGSVNTVPVQEGKKFTDVELEFIKGRFEDDAAQMYLKEAALQENSYLTVAIAVKDSAAAIKTALSMPVCVFDCGASVLIRQEHSYAIVSMLSRKQEGVHYRKYKNIRPFGMLDNAYDISQSENLLPMMIKYVYDNTSDEKFVKEFPVETIRKNWIENWRKTDNVSALKASNRYAANFISVKQRSLGIQEGADLDSKQINLAARMEHNRWVMEKLLIGFRAPTPEEAAGIAQDKKREYYKSRLIHEDIKGYQELGEDDKKIDVKIYDINISASLPYIVKAYRSVLPT
ncbi:MAG: hypothetical protein LBH16_11730 [Treponema sp.]|jgi:hypothetical protein|nr:hypothetical protein [Treponema sp.]